MLDDNPVPTEKSAGWVRRRAHVQAQIERAALDLCVDRSPDEITVDEIARAAGISQRTFFRYFRARADVFAALPLRHTEYLCAHALVRPGHEGVLEAFTGAAAQGGDEFEDDMLRHWAQTVGSSLPIEGWSTDSIVDAYAQVIAEREHLPIGDPTVRVWAAALAGASASAFEEWMERGGSRTEILADAWEILAQLNDATRPRGQRRPARASS
jgi:AcrR family transcriptional regulator